MRVYGGAGRELLMRLVREGSAQLNVVVPDGEDESDELAAMEFAATQGPVVVAADVDDGGESVVIELHDVAAWHVDVDGSGFLAWYATQEVDQVIALLKER